MYITHQGGSAEVFYTEGQLAQGYTEPNDYGTSRRVGIGGLAFLVVFRW